MDPCLLEKTHWINYQFVPYDLYNYIALLDYYGHLVYMILKAKRNKLKHYGIGTHP